MKLLLLFLPLWCGSPAPAADAPPASDTTFVNHIGRYCGQYPSGEGVFYSEKSGIIIGHFEKGVPHGVCTHYAKNGSRYYGEFADGFYSGRGIQFRNTGSVCVGTFENGSATGVDTIYYKQSIYVGTCVKGVPEGDGILYTHPHYIHKERKYFFLEGLFVRGTFTSGIFATCEGISTTSGGHSQLYLPHYGIDASPYSQEELRYRYHALRALQPRKFPGAKLSPEQRQFLQRIGQQPTKGSK